MTLSLDTAYRSFGGEVEASSTPTICRLPDSRRHQLSAIALKNWGNTPARKGTVKFEFALRDAIQRDPVIPFTDKAETMENLVFAPGHQQVLHINRNEISRVERGGGCERAAYVWGRLDYIDAFDKPRFTTFQVVHTFTEVEEFAVCANGNEAQ
jgi:hypothetical protein